MAQRDCTEETQEIEFTTEDDREFAQTWFGQLGYGHKLINDPCMEDTYDYC